MELGIHHCCCRLSIRDTDYACLDEGPNLMPSSALGSHLGNPPLPTASVLESKERKTKDMIFLELGSKGCLGEYLQ